MKHVTHRLESWLGGELAPDEAARVEAHLATCPECRTEAHGQRELWEALAAAAPAPVQGSVWPTVQARTTRDTGGVWFFGGTPIRRIGLVAGALAMGLLAGVLVPGGGTVAADEVDAGAPWLSGATWTDGGEVALDDLWLTEVTAEEATP